MKTSLFSLLLAVGATTLAVKSAAPALAEEKAAPAQSVKSEDRAQEYDLEIVNGQLLLHGRKVPASLANAVEALRERYRESNIVLSPGLSAVVLEDLKLRASRLPEELEALRIASGNQFMVRAPNRPPTIDPNTGLPVPVDNVDSGLFVLEKIQAPEGERMVEAFNVGPYLEWAREHAKQSKQKDVPPEDSVGEVGKMVLETLHRFNRNPANENATDFQYYKDANLFVVIGSREAVDIARKIINVLPGMSAPDNPAAGRYGLAPGAMPSAGSDPAMDAFRRRYGLGPGSSTPGAANPAGQTPAGK